ncbi:hypothetical protein RVY14_004590, partial [Enterobacter cloacae]|nr:hypothetical protein [Enterobacter cloacae]
MTDNKVILAVNNGDGKTRLLTADAGRTVKVKLIPGNKYLLKNINDDFAPENITLQRVDKALHIIQEGDTQPSIIIEDYFNGDPNNPVLMGMAEDGLLYAYVPLSGESYDTGYLMADGSMSPVALGGEPLGAGGPLLTAPDDDNDMLFGMLGWFALAAAGVGAAFALSEMDKDDGDNHSTPDDVGSSRGDLSNGSTTDDANPTFKGSAEPGSRVDIYDNGELIGSTMVDENGGWQFTPTTALPEGEHHITTTATDEAGNTGPESDDFVLITDYTAPDASKVAITEVYDDVNTAGVIASGGETDDNRPLIKGTGAEPGNTITVYNGDKVIGTAKVQADGTWSLEPTTPLPDGKYTLTAKETDGVGNVSGPSGEYIINVATVPPQAPTLDTVYDDVAPHADYLQKGDVTNDTTPTLSGSSGVAGGTISIYDNGRLIGTTSVAGNGSWSFTPDTALADGSHNFTATVTDGVG